MSFHLRSNGGNYVGAEWIAAEGEITDETPGDLEAFMRSVGLTENPGGWSVRLHSPGGSLSGGIRLGELIRRLKLGTEIGSTDAEGHHWKRVPGHCASACAFAFLGGLSRDASGSELGAHQFYDEISLRDPSARVFSSLDMSQHQFISALLIDYVFRMGVDPRLVSIAASTPPMEMTFLSDAILDDLRVRWHPKELEPWSIEPNGKGVIAVTRSRDRSRTVTIASLTGGLLRILIEDTHSDHIDTDWLNSASGVISSVEAFDRKFPKDALKATLRNEVLEVEFTLHGIDGKTIANSERCGVGVDGPRYMWGPFTYEMPRQNAEAAIGVVLNNHIR
jgi:hypothetical protein